VASILTKKSPPRQPLRLDEVLRLIAWLGRFLGRKGDGEAGAKAAWIGLQGVKECVAGIEFAIEAHGL
jgi:hypothetical protein